MFNIYLKLLCHEIAEEPLAYTMVIAKGYICWYDIYITRQKTNVMLKWAAIFFVIAIIAAIFGFTDIAAGAAGVAKIIFFIFLVLILLTFILGATIFKK